MLLKSAKFNGQEFKFYTTKPDERANTYTIIIGKNGVGKSRLLTAISQVFRKLDTFRAGIGYNDSQSLEAHELIRFTYEQDGKTVEMNLLDTNKLEIKVDGKKLVEDDEIKNAPYPARVIATTVSPFDKFPMDMSGVPYPINRDLLIYNYLGGKGVKESNMALGRMSRILRTRATTDASSPRVEKHLAELFKVLNYEPDGFVDYRWADFPKNLRAALDTHGGEHVKLQVGNTFQQWLLECRIYSQGVFPTIEVKKQIIDAIDYVESKAVPNVPSVLMKWNFLDSFNKDSLEDMKHITTLQECRALNIRGLILERKGKPGPVNLPHASSGEQGTALVFLGIASKLQNDSIIFIDEPEIGLHPEWQEQFINLIDKCFANYAGCHFILATHSPQILAGKHRNSYVVSMFESSNKTMSLKDYEHKSADVILADLLKAPGWKNEYIARIAMSALEFINENEWQNDTLKEDIDTLSKVRANMKKEDRLTRLVDSILAAYRSKKS